MIIELYEHTGLQQRCQNGHRARTVDGTILGRRPIKRTVVDRELELVDIKPADGSPVITAFVRQ